MGWYYYYWMGRATATENRREAVTLLLFDSDSNDVGFVKQVKIQGVHTPRQATLW